jgi:hypothetical protein
MAIENTYGGRMSNKLGKQSESNLVSEAQKNLAD